MTKSGLEFGLAQVKKFGITLPAIIAQNTDYMLKNTEKLLFGLGIAMVTFSGLVILGLRHAALPLVLLIEGFILLIHLPQVLEKGFSF